MPVRIEVLCLSVLALACHHSPPDEESAAAPRTATLRCVDMIVPGLIVEIRDARSGRWIADSAIALARAGSYVDTLRDGAVVRDTAMKDRRGAWERPGTYSVEVRRAGYGRWRASGIVVGQDPCHVTTVELLAELEPDH